MAFEVKCLNCECCEAEHYMTWNECEEWKPERPLTEEERQWLRDDGEEPTH